MSPFAIAPAKRALAAAVFCSSLVGLAACGDVTAPARDFTPTTAALNAGAHLPAPSNISTSVSGTSVTVTWTAVDGAGAYKVDLCTTTDNCVATATTSALTYTFNSAATGSYVVRVRARTDVSADQTGQNDGWGDFGYGSATVGGTVTPPTQPTDNTPPVVTFTVSGTQGSNGWYTSDVTVTWSVTDAESSVTSAVGCSTTVQNTDVAAQTFTCTATSAGGSTTKSVTISRDATPPSVTYTGNALTYDVDKTVAITCSASDAMSGLASSTCANIAGDAYTFTLGANNYSATALDNAGNTGNGATSFSVVATSGGTCNLVKRWVTNAGVANSLCVKLDAASRAGARGDLNAKAGSIKAFGQELQAQSGKFVPADKVAILLRITATI